MKLTSEAIGELIKTFYNMLAYDAVDCLCSVFGAGYQSIFMHGDEYFVSDLYDHMDIYSDMLARELDLGFYGGPPGSHKQMQDNLLTLLLDNFLYAYIRNQQSTVIKALKYAEF